MTQARIIAVETSGRRGSAALAEGPALLAEAAFAADAEHARALLPILDGLVRSAGGRFMSDATGRPQIDHCYLSIGPGSFTGLRVAVAFARHLALAAGVRLVAVPTLAVIAENALSLSPPPARLAVILDAKRSQVFGAVYEHRGDLYEPMGGPSLVSPADLLAGKQLADEELAVIGEGVAYHREAVAASGAVVLDESLWWPRAAMVHRIGWRMAEAGQFTPPGELLPLYVRRPEAEELWEKRAAASMENDARQ